VEYIRQVNAKEIDEDWFQELVAELDMERAMGESIAEGLATMQAMTQDEEVGESERDESAEEEPKVVEKVVESLTVSKGKQKAAPARAKMYSEVDGPVNDSAKVVVNIPLTDMLTVQPMFYVEDEAKMCHDTPQAALQEVPV
jgi:hypothetical protein